MLKQTLTIKQQTALNAVNIINRPCGLSTILAATKGAFDSTAQLKEILAQLCSLRLVKLQANSQYKIPVAVVASKKSQTKTIKKVTKKSAKTSLTIKSEHTEMSNEPKKEVKKQVVISQGSSVLLSVRELATRLNKPKFSIDDFSDKCATLEQLGVVLSDDIEVMLLAIRDDLKKAVA